MLATLVLQRCIASNRPRTSRSGLLASVPVKEAVYARLGLDALVDHGMLRASGDDIGFTETGNVFLAYVEGVRDASPTLDEDTRDHATLTPLLKAIERDHRLVPPTIDDMHTLPGRLETYREARRFSFLSVWTIVAAVGLIAILAVLIR